MVRFDLRLVLALVALLSGCSIVIGEITPPPCTDDDECEVLNSTPPEGEVITNCRRYQCTGNPASPGTCVYRPTDADDDGQIAAMCPNGTDCDDSRPTVGENLPELCDGLDNDCDLVIDDGDFSGAGPTIVGTASGANEVTWGESGSGSYVSSGPTRAFRFGSDGSVVSMMVTVRTNAVPSYNNLANSEAPVEGCLSRATQFLAPDPLRDGGGICATDDDCIRAICPIAAGGTAGECRDPADGGTLTCTSNDQCSELCVSGRCVPPTLLGSATILRSDVQRSSACNLSDLATAPVGSLGSFAVGVSTQGCSAGILRAGWLGSDGATLSMVGPEARSNVWLGVDVGAFSEPRDGGTVTIACSGRERGAPGASRPAVAALSSERDPQALVAYLGTPLRSGDGSAGRARCADPATTTPVEVLGLFKESGGASAAIKDWVTASNEGRPGALGDTSGVAAPAVAGLVDTGWVVAYPEATASGPTPIALHLLRRMTPPAPFVVTLPGGMTATAKEARPTAPLAPTEAFATIPASGRADYVALAFGAERGGVQDVGVVWMEDCSVNDPATGAVSPSETVWFALVRFDAATPGSATVTEPVQLSTSTAPGGQPTIAYAGPGISFVSPGWARGDGAPVADDRRGGFVVAWAGAAGDELRDAVYAVRVAESDGLPVDAAPAVLPVVTVDGFTVPAETVSLYETHESATGRVSFGAIDGRDDFVGGSFVCPPAL